MKKKIVGMFVCMLLIATTTTVTLADWNPDDGWKMHFPQYPDPYGFDVDFGWWELGDDWKCTETGPVSDIHFWISWYDDDPRIIDWIKVSIWSNNPGPPSTPAEMLWSREFLPDEFIVAGPWEGNQSWLFPWGEIGPENHEFYYQINIPEIDDPFIQQEGEIYWLVIRMPFEYDWVVGWKTSKDHFADSAVWWNYELNEWQPIIPDQDLAFVITTKDDKKCCLAIESMSGGLFDTPSSLTVNAVIKNTGDAECRDIKWSFGFSGGLVLWGPKSGTEASLLPGDTVTVSSGIVIGLGIPGIFPCNVTIHADATNNACPAVSMEKGIFLFFILLKVIP